MREETDARKQQKMKAEEEHSEDPERGDGKWMRTQGNKEQAGGGEEEEETKESRLRKTVRYLTALDRAENKKEPHTRRRKLWR